ncbi:MAG: gliding motility-associated C-terminal domain-containing protein [Bacteroidetes bacterium]|nr:gliding motility-associated C-terminal domain-containing protein [Bacteroidota bacterium]
MQVVVHLQDTLSPVTPIIKDVSVNNLGKAVVSWEPSAGADLYIIYLQDANGAWITLDTVLFGTNSYLFVNSNATISTENFTVRALDSCGNTRVRSEIHNSILVTNSADVCDYTISLDWNDYINWSGGVSHYNVFILETDENNIITNSVVRVSGNSQLLIEDISPLVTYAVYIKAYNFDSTFVAVSNVLNVTIPLPKKPLFNYLAYATVDHADGLVEINCLVDNNAIIDHYDIYRTNEFGIAGDGINFSKIEEVAFSGNTNFIYKDIDVNSATTYYRYKVYPVDTCGVSLTPPAVAGYNEASYAQTILLNVEVNVDFIENPDYKGQYTNTITFSEYDKWLGNVSKYGLYKSSNGDPFFQLPIYTWDRVDKPNEELKYIDVVTNEGKKNGSFCYYIHAIEGNTTPYNAVPEGSYSNIVCVLQIPTIYIPNTFTPNGDDHNEVFKPMTYFVSEEGYSFSIYNRAGEKIFETDNPQKGWDGSYKGAQVQNGNYVYHLQFLNDLGNLTEKTDVINLVR